MSASRFVDSPLLEDDGEELPEVPSRLDDYEDDATTTLTSTQALLEAKYSDGGSKAASIAASMNNSRKSNYAVNPSAVAGERQLNNDNTV